MYLNHVQFIASSGKTRRSDKCAATETPSRFSRSLRSSPEDSNDGVAVEKPSGTA